MGNEQSKKNNNVEIQLNHPRINFIRVINDPKRRYMQALFAVQKEDYNTWKTHLQKAKLNSNHLLLPFDHKFSTKQFCGNSGSAQLNFENYPYLLVQQIENRKAKKKRFDQTELWLLLFCLLDAQKEMKSGNDSRIGDVRPQNIFFNEQGLMKVANVLSWPKQTINYQKFLQNQPTYLAPQDMPLIQSSKIDNSQNTQSQIFSIGLTILSTANLVDHKSLYNTTTRRFNVEQFSTIVNQWRLNDYYSDIFKATLCSMIEIDKANRIHENFLFPWLEKYREDILARKDFVITDPPQLVINQVQVIRKLYQNVSSGYNMTATQPLNSSLYNSEFKKIGAPLQGSRRLVEEKRYPPIKVIPGSSAAESIYHPVSNPVFINRVPTSLENQALGESVYVKHWSSQGSTIPKMNFQYRSSSPQKNTDQPNLQNKQQEPKQQQNNQPQIQQDSPQHTSPKKE